MKKKNIVEMIFRKVKSGKFKNDIIAFILPMYNANNLTAYAHVGGHWTTDYWYYLKDTVPATENEYAPLLKELDQLYCHNNDGDDFDAIRVKRKITFQKRKTN